jgi:PAS domain S-box-containing protein
MQVLPTALYAVDAEGRLTFYNEAAADLWGSRPTLGEHWWNGFGQLHWPNGTPMTHDDWPMAIMLKTGKSIQDVEALATRADGTRYSFTASATPMNGIGGELIGAVSVLIDITERRRIADDDARLLKDAQDEVAARRRGEDAAALFLQEVQHRIKNTLGTVQAIAGQTFRTASEAERQEFNARIQAFARAHDLMARQHWDGATVADVVKQTLVPFLDRGRDNFQFTGPKISLNANKSLLLAMVLHELGTNAIKYGALSDEKGRVSLTWDLADGAKGKCIRLRWREADGPYVQPPQRKGFGSTLIERALESESGKAHIEFAPSGVTCSMDISV